MADVAAEGQDGAADAVAGEPAAGQGRLVVPHAAVDRGDGDPDRRALKKLGVKTYGFLGYSDAYGEAWLKDITPLAEKAGIKLVAVERFARTDTSVTGQALKLMSANPDAILVVASGSGAAMPHKGLVERGYPRRKIYQTHGAATMDLIRVGGNDVEGSFVVVRPGGGRRAAARQQRQQGARRAVHERVREGLRQGLAQPVRRPRVRRRHRAGEGGADRAEEGQAGHAGVPRRAEGRVRDDGPHAGLAGRAQLDRDRPLRLHARDRRDAEGRRTATGRSCPERDARVLVAALRGRAPRPPAAAMPTMDLSIAGILLLDGVTNGAVYALLALAIVLVFAVTRVIFIPQGEFVAYGALTLALLQLGKVPGTVWLLLALAALAALLDLADARAARPAGARRWRAAASRTLVAAGRWSSR